MTKYQKRIGDGKLPNIYYVFHYDEKCTRDEYNNLNYPIDEKVEGGYIGQFRSYKKAIDCVNNKAYLPHVFIEDRITGVVFEQYVEICECCGKEEYTTIEDIDFTRKKLGSDFI